jgi:hypothetical protein
MEASRSSPSGPYRSAREFAKAEPCRERKRDQRPGEAALEPGVVGLGRLDDRGALLAGEDPRRLLPFGVRRDADARARVHDEFVVALGDPQGDAERGQRLAGVLGCAFGGDLVDEPLDVAAGESLDWHVADPRDDDAAERLLVLADHRRFERPTVPVADGAVEHAAGEPPGRVLDPDRTDGQRDFHGRPRQLRSRPHSVRCTQCLRAPGERLLERRQRGDQAPAAAADPGAVADAAVRVAALVDPAMSDRVPASGCGHGFFPFVVAFFLSAVCAVARLVFAATAIVDTSIPARLPRARSRASSLRAARTSFAAAARRAAFALRSARILSTSAMSAPHLQLGDLA